MEDLIYLKVGTFAMIAMEDGTIYKGYVKDVDILEEKVTLSNYRKFKYTLAGYVEAQCFNCEITIGATDVKPKVLTCMGTDPLFPLITGISPSEEL